MDTQVNLPHHIARVLAVCAAVACIFCIAWPAAAYAAPSLGYRNDSVIVVFNDQKERVASTLSFDEKGTFPILDILPPTLPCPVFPLFSRHCVREPHNCTKFQVFSQFLAFAQTNCMFFGLFSQI